MKLLQLSLSLLLFLLPWHLNAQYEPLLKFSTEGGIGRTNYTNNDILKKDWNGSFIWSASLQGSRFWELTSRWSVASELGAQINYYHLQSDRSLEDLQSLMALDLSGQENTLDLKRAEHSISLVNINGSVEYSLFQGKFHNFLLLGGIQLQRLLIANVNTVYQEPATGFSKGFDIFGTANTLNSTESEPDINSFFQSRVPKWQVNLRAGFAFTFHRRKNPSNQFYLFYIYEHGLTQVSKGLSRPVRGLRSGTGYRFGI